MKSVAIGGYSPELSRRGVLSSARIWIKMERKIIFRKERGKGWGTHSWARRATGPPVIFRQLEELYSTTDRKWNRFVQETHRTVKPQSDVIRQNSTTGFAL